MALRILMLLMLGCVCAAPATNDLKKVEDQKSDDLKTAASTSYVDRYSDFGTRNYPSSSYSSYSVTGFGTLDDKYNYNTFGGAYRGYDNSNVYSGYDKGYSGFSGYNGNVGYDGYKSGYGGNAGYDGYKGGYGGNAGYDGYKGGYGGNAGYDGYKGGYGGSPGYSGYGGNGGYGGYAGNGGLSTYSGYSNPNYQGAYHLGYGYYKRPGYGNIYNGGITPSLVTGYRGYSRK